MDKFSVEVPINSLSFGNVSLNILREMYSRELNPPIFLIGDRADFSAFDKYIDAHKEFPQWLEKNARRALSEHDRNNPIFKLWHLNGSLNSFSKNQYLFTFYECDSPTPSELNVVKNQSKVFVSSSYSKTIFEQLGCENIIHCPLGFDDTSFHETNKKYHTEDRIVFGLVGKLEKRKQHHKVIKSWVKKFGNNPKYVLNCAIQNPFIPEDQQAAVLMNLLDGEKPYNVNFLGFMPSNTIYNDYLNSNDIIIGMSAAEGWGLPEFQSLCLGKHGVILNAHAYKDWATESNAILVNPSEKIDCYDGTFFKEGSPFNQGKYFDWNEDEFIPACEKAVERFNSNPINEEGRTLKEEFTWAKATDTILDTMGVK